MKTSNDHLSDWTKQQLQSTSQSQTCTKKKKDMITVWWTAAHLIHYSFLNPGETTTSKKYAQQINENWHQELPQLQLALVNRMGSILPHDNTQPHITQSMLLKLNELDYKVLQERTGESGAFGLLPHPRGSSRISSCSFLNVEF